MGKEFDAIVVGGGFAGATAARELGVRGQRTLLIEARDRLGGRCFTSSFAGQRVEMGGTKVHWLQAHVWAEITRYDIPIFEYPQAESYVMPCGSEVASYSRDEVLPRLDELWERYMEGTREAFDQPFNPLLREEAVRALDGLSLRDRLNQLRLSQEDENWLAGGRLSWLGGGPMEHSSFTTIARQWALAGWNSQLFSDIHHRYALEPGTIALIEPLVADAQAEVLLGSPVSRIVHGDDAVHVTTRAGDMFSAPVAIVAVPVNVWPFISFSPPLSASRLAAAGEGIGVSHGYKVWVHVRGTFGPVNIQTRPGSPFQGLMTAKMLQDGQLLVAIGADPSMDVGDRKQVRRALTDLLPDAEIVGLAAHDWAKDEFSRGAWPHMKPGQLTKYLRELQQPQGRVVFATSDIASGWHGYIDGAIESGITAGRRALYLTGASRSMTRASRRAEPGVRRPRWLSREGSVQNSEEGGHTPPAAGLPDEAP
jgi:monoamine oxidase